jgi:hypothetical protein
MPRIERDPNEPHKMKVYDDEGNWIGSGHEEVGSAPDWPNGITRSVPLMFVMDYSQSGTPEAREAWGRAARERGEEEPWQVPSHKPGDDEDDFDEKARVA